MNELSLFSGIGGGALASKLLDHRLIGYVENHPFCQKVLKERISDGCIDKAPIFGDINEFNQSGAARQYRGIAQLVSAGFPCQPFSVSGKRQGKDDPRNCWPETFTTIREVRPEYVFLENVSGLLTSGYFDQIMSDLAETGFNAKWVVLGADDCGAYHHRKRLWILAHNEHNGRVAAQKRRSANQRNDDCEKGTRSTVQFKGCGAVHSYCVKMRVQRHQPKAVQRFSTLSRWQNVGGVEDFRNRSDIPEPLVRRMDDGFSNRMERTKALGNAQVPIVAARAFQTLMDA